MQDYDTLMKLAERGDEANVSIMMKELKKSGKDESYDAFPDLMEVFSFGRAASLNKGRVS